LYITSQGSGQVGHEINMKGWQCNDISSTIPKRNSSSFQTFLSLKMDWQLVIIRKTYKASAVTTDVSEW